MFFQVAPDLVRVIGHAVGRAEKNNPARDNPDQAQQPGDNVKTVHEIDILSAALKTINSLTLYTRVPETDNHRKRGPTNRK